MYDDTENKEQPNEIRTHKTIIGERFVQRFCPSEKRTHPLKIPFWELFVFEGAARCQSNSYFSLTGYRGGYMPTAQL